MHLISGGSLLLFYYSFYSFIAIGRIAAIARFHFIRHLTQSGS